MSCHNKLQQLCRKYLKKLYRKARDIGLDEFVEKTIAENENGRCTATVEQVNMLASLCGDDRIKKGGNSRLTRSIIPEVQRTKDF